MMLQQLLLSFVALSLLFSPWRAPVAKSYSADRFDVDVDVQADGSLLVTERLTLRFVGGPFTYVFRHLPTEYTDGVDVISASIDGVPLSEGKEAGQVEIAGRDPVEVTWHFAPTSDSTHTFDLTYRVWGVIRQETGADVLVWQALPDEYEYSIAASTIVVTYPETAPLLGAPEVQQGAATIMQSANTVMFNARDLKPNSTLIVALRFGAGSLIDAPPQWQAQGTSGNRAGLVFALIGSTVVALIAILLAVFISRARIPSARGETPLTLPPSDLPPAIAGVLMRNGSVDATWAWAYVLGACFDLARRGVIGIEEMQRTSWLQGRDFVFRLNSTAASLRPHERGVIETLFHDKSGLQSEVRLSKLQNSLYSRLKSFTQALKSECESLGFFDAERQRRRSAQIVWGVLLMLLGVGLIVAAAVLMSTLGVWPLFIAIAIPIVGFVLILVGASFSPLNEDYQQTALQWKSFAKYLGDVTRQRDTLVHRDQFEGYLSYAAAFGLAEPWSRYLKKHEDIEVPAWFRALAASEDGGRGAFVAMMAASSSTGGTSAGGAGGAAGGGASGAG